MIVLCLVCESEGESEQSCAETGRKNCRASGYGCNHAVFLSECNYEANEYTIWTWGSLAKLRTFCGVQVTLHASRGQFCLV